MSDGRTHWEGCERDRGHQECALARLDAVTAERDAYKAHYDKLSGEMDLLGLLDLYFEWTEEARSERDALAEALRDAHSELQFCARSFSEMGGSGPAHAKRIRRLLPCAECGGAGALDSGGVDPAGNSVDVACPICGRAVGGY